MKHLLLVGLCSLCLLCSAQAANRVALVIGNAAYEKEEALRNPVNDAKLIAETLRGKLGFEKVITLYNASQTDMLQTMSSFRKESQGAQLALIYYSGHGMSNSKRQNHLLPVDMPRISANANLDADTVLKARAINEDDLIEAVEGAKVQLVILDACRNNNFASNNKSAQKGLARREEQSRNRLIAYATEQWRTAEDGKGSNSTYAQSLAKHLQRTDQPILKIFDDVAQDVENATNGAQSPTRSGNLRTDVYLVASLVSVAVVPEPARPAAPTAPPAPLVQSSAPAVDALKAGSIIKDCADCPEMVVIPGGRFMMGSPASEAGRSEDEGPMHEVRVKGFALAKTEVTRGQWRRVMGSNPSYFKDCGEDCPVETVSWEEAQAYVRKLSEKTGKAYRLPSEAEWEYACRAGGQGRYCGGGNLDAVAWYEGNSANKIHAVARKQANAFGLYDMSGSVFEWVEDCWHDSYKGAPSDGSAWRSGNCGVGVLRGGSWDDLPQNARAAVRNSSLTEFRDISLGFRPARMLP